MTSSQTQASSQRGSRPDQDGEAGGRIARVVRALVTIAAVLGLAAYKAAERQAAGGDGPRIDMSRVWALLDRAKLWARALQGRMARAARAERAEAERESLFDRERLDDGEDWEEDAVEDPEDCIAGLTDAEVVAQICADLVAAAKLIGDSKSARSIAAIAEATKTLLSGAPPTASARPVTRPSPTPARGGAAQSTSSGVRAPDTG